MILRFYSERLIDRQAERVKPFGGLQENNSSERYLQLACSFVQFLWTIRGIHEFDERQTEALNVTEWDVEKIQELLESMFMKKYGVNVDRFLDPTYLFLAYQGMEETELQFKEPESMTGMLAALKFIIRLVVFRCVHLDETKAIDLMCQEYDRTVFIFVKKNSTYVTPFGLVAEMMSLFSVATNGLIHKSNTQVDHVNPGETITFKGVKVTKTGLRESVKKIISLANEMLKDLVFDFDLDFVDKKLEAHEWREPLRNQMRGGSILRSRIVMQISEQLLKKKPCFETKRQINQFLEKSWEFRKLLILLCHLTSGQPARGTEIASMTVTNSDSLKSLYWRENCIITCTVYNKINSVTGSDHVICRFLAPEVTKLILIDLSIVKVLERYVLLKCLKLSNSVQ
jgi:hypothetical protein